MSIWTKKNTVTIKLQEMRGRSMNLRGFFNRVTYRQYQDFQAMRWQSEGGSEQNRWKPLNPIYAAYKLKRYGGGLKYRTGKKGEGRWVKDGRWPRYPGRGTKLMIATGRLFRSVVGPGKYTRGFGGPLASASDHRKLVTATKIKIYTTVPYAEDANDKRQFFGLSKKSVDVMKRDIVNYVRRGQDGKR